MGKYLSKLSRRSARNWNIENRAQRELDRQRSTPKIRPTSKHTVNDSDKATLNLMTKEETGSEPKKNEALDSMLKKVRLDSYGPAPEIRSIQKNLPENRGLVETPEFGYNEPTQIPIGKCSLRQALEFITDHQERPEDYTTKDIADNYKLTEAHVQKVIKYFHMLNLQLPKGSSGQKLIEEERSAAPLYKLLSKDSKTQAMENPDKTS